MDGEEENGLATVLDRSFCNSVMYLLGSIGLGTLPPLCL